MVVLKMGWKLTPIDRHLHTAAKNKVCTIHEIMTTTINDKWRQETTTTRRTDGLERLTASTYGPDRDREMMTWV